MGRRDNMWPGWHCLRQRRAYIDGGRRERSRQAGPVSPRRCWRHCRSSLVSFITEIITGWAHPLVQEAQSGFASCHHCPSRVCGPPGTIPDGQTGQASSAFLSLTHALPEGPAPRALGGGENRWGGLANLGRRREARAVFLKFRGLDQVS